MKWSDSKILFAKYFEMIFFFFTSNTQRNYFPEQSTQFYKIVNYFPRIVN